MPRCTPIGTEATTETNVEQEVKFATEHELVEPQVDPKLGSNKHLDSFIELRNLTMVPKMYAYLCMLMPYNNPLVALFVDCSLHTLKYCVFVS